MVIWFFCVDFVVLGVVLIDCDFVECVICEVGVVMILILVLGEGDVLIYIVCFCFIKVDVVLDEVIVWLVRFCVMF